MGEGKLTNANSPKVVVAKRILEKGIVKVHCDPRVEGVHVPPHLSEDPMLLLQFAYGFRLPGFQVDEEAISGVLNFNGLRYHCVIPWEAVFALTAPEFGHEGHFWPEDVPVEMMENAEVEGEEKTLEPVRSGPVLSVVAEVSEESAVEEEESVDETLTPGTPAPLPNRNHLRLIRDDN